MPMKPCARGALLALGLAAFGLPASAMTLEISVTNLAADGGLSFTPVWAGIHDGSFDAFDAQTPASPALERLAELGDAAEIGPLLAAVDADAVETSIGGAPILPGQSASQQVNINADSARYFSYLSMILPSNDTFFGNDTAVAYQLFDAGGAFLGDTTITVYGTSLYDAGTEVNDPLNGAPFIIGNSPTAGATEGDVIRGATSLAGFAGLQTPFYTIDGGLIDFTTDPTSFAVAQISIREITPVPLPASGLLMFGGLGLLGAAARRRRPT